jgi:hypothetical protein
MILVERSAKLVDVLEHERHIVEQTELRLHVVERTGERAFAARAVVTHYVDDQRIVAQAHAFDRVDNLADLGIDVLEETGVDLLHPRVQAFFIC